MIGDSSSSTAILRALSFSTEGHSCISDSWAVVTPQDTFVRVGELHTRCSPEQLGNPVHSLERQQHCILSITKELAPMRETQNEWTWL
jgi:hypothetical protein